MREDIRDIIHNEFQSLYQLISDRLDQFEIGQMQRDIGRRVMQYVIHSRGPQSAPSTPQGNINHGRSPHKPYAKLTVEGVKYIKQRLAYGLETQKRIAEDFGVHRSLISKIKRGVVWHDVRPDFIPERYNH